MTEKTCENCKWIVHKHYDCFYCDDCENYNNWKPKDVDLSKSTESETMAETEKKIKELCEKRIKQVKDRGNADIFTSEGLAKEILKILDADSKESAEPNVFENKEYIFVSNGDKISGGISFKSKLLTTEDNFKWGDIELLEKAIKRSKVLQNRRTFPSKRKDLGEKK